MNLNSQWPCTNLLATLLCFALFGCAGEKAHRDGLELLDVGRVEDGLAKLEVATREAPDNLNFRADLIRKRELIVNRMLLAADNERRLGRPDEAELLYERVLKLDRTNPRAKAGLSAVIMDRRHADTLVQAHESFKKSDHDNARAKLQSILLENPGNDEAKQLRRKIDEVEAKSAMMSPSLQSKFKKPVTLQFRDANLKMVFEALSRTAGVNILLDKDVKSDLKTTIFVNNASVEDSIDLILLQNQLDKKILNENTVFVYPNLPAKTKDYQDLVIRSFHLINSDAKQMLTMVKTLLKTKDIYIHEKTNSLIMRDTPEAVRLAEKLVADQDLDEPEVMLEVEVLEIKRSTLTQLGIKYPDQVIFSVTESPAVQTSSVTSGGAVVTTTTPASPLTLEGLKNINSSSIKVNPLSLTLDLQKQDGDTNVLASPRIRARSKEKAKIHIGDRVPVITNSVTPVSTGTPVVTGNVQYLDVGLKLEVEPDVHLDDEVAIKMFLEVSSIVREINNASSGTVAYQIGTRTASTLLRLKDGETQVLAGLINDEDRKAASKVPGLGDLPVLGRLFSSHRNSTEKTEIVLSITPHVIRNVSMPDAHQVEFWSGTESNLRTKPLTLQPMGTVGFAAPAAAAQPGTAGRQSWPPQKPDQPLPAPTTATVMQPSAMPAPVAKQPLPAAAPSSLLLNWEGPAQAKVGEQFTITLNAQAEQGISRLPLVIGFDASALKVVDVNEGNLLRQSDPNATFSRKVDDGRGQIIVEMGTPSPQGTSGSGSLVTVTFQAIAAKPKSEISVVRMAPSRPSGQGLPYRFPSPFTISLEQP